MRLFTAIDLPEELVASLSKLLAGLKPTARINWSPPQNLHITTKFIGEWPEERLPELTTALHAVPRRPAIPIVIEKLGLFPNPHSPRVLWAGIQAGETLAQLARDTEDALAPLGIAKEQRPTRPISRSRASKRRASRLADKLKSGNIHWMSAAALAVMTGHAFPIFLKFHGGKAVARNRDRVPVVKRPRQNPPLLRVRAVPLDNYHRAEAQQAVTEP